MQEISYKLATGESFDPHIALVVRGRSQKADGTFEKEVHFMGFPADSQYELMIYDRTSGEYLDKLVHRLIPTR